MLSRHENGTMRAMPQNSKQEASGFFGRLRRKLSGGKGLGLTFGLSGHKFDAELEEELETQLLLADVGLEATDRIISGLRRRIGSRSIGNDQDIRDALRESLIEILEPHAQPLVIPSSPRPYLILVVGVNGSGKTTTIGKLAKKLTHQGLSVMLAAGDTFRAAAIEQLQAWGERNEIPVIAQQSGADPAAVVYDAFEAARARGIDVILADTAGRLQNKSGLMDELAKVVRIAARLDPEAPHERMLVLDSSQGQNAVNQAVEFHQAIGLTGITMTKLDGGGKGGVLLSIAEQLDVPFRYIGVGEDIDDMGVFNAEQYAAALVEPE
ncbi:MAG: signal recognition particle-docking protein FtsY [Gammaproteobacteria bacterium]|jgi:fused signal recognition particle receptor|nr:signal recognition particle-docking protein FtsY [Chromatiales bacterium]MDP6675621.1 signal recognition particle-docking protein FtsY [Gammaproteobacteria bacterium]